MTHGFSQHARRFWKSGINKYLSTMLQRRHFKLKCEMFLTIIVDKSKSVACFLAERAGDIVRCPCCSRWLTIWTIDGWTDMHNNFKLVQDWATANLGIMSIEMQNYLHLSLGAYKRFTRFKKGFRNKPKLCCYASTVSRAPIGTYIYRWARGSCTLDYYTVMLLLYLPELMENKTIHPKQLDNVWHLRKSK